MGLFVSTVSANVVVPELGITLAHPTTERQLDTQFSAAEIKAAESLTTAIQAGTLTWKKAAAGSTELASSYDPDFVELEAEALGGQSSFGSYLHKVESAVESSTTSTTVFTTKLTLTTTSLPLGDYVMIVQYRFRVAAANRGHSTQVLDGSTVIMLDENFLPSTSERPMKTNIVELPGISGVKTFSLQFKAGVVGLTTGTTAFLSEAKATLWRIK